MRSRALMKTAFLLFAAGLLCIVPCRSLPAADRKAEQNHKRYRIGYLEGGPHWSFSGVLDHARKALAERGWLDKIEFPSELHSSPGWGDNEAALRKYAEALLDRKDVDIILSAGTDATLATLAVNNGSVPIIGMSVSDPVKSGMVAGPDDSGVDNFTTYLEPDAYARLFRIFHAAVGFQKLGLLYSNTPNGQLYANREEAYQIARERGFKVMEYGRVSAGETEEECMAGIQWLVQQGIDAFYVPSLACFDYALNPQSSQRLHAYLMEEKIPTFDREGTFGVRSGALLGLSNLNQAREGEFLADMIIRIFQGESPRSLPMVFSVPPSLSLNMYTAERIGYIPSFDLLTACDVIFRKITIVPCPPIQ